ncbi:hypothetical protein AB4Z46_08715 [Variovorax sp. M-6]|uniref:hypothetical protein n=1 Tax=Variovorax sp. M-6 TaxID=3233041 RepID=UPI003F979CC2
MTPSFDDLAEGSLKRKYHPHSRITVFLYSHFARMDRLQQQDKGETMPPFNPSLNVGRVLPLRPAPRLAARSSWPFRVAREQAPAPPIRAQAARVIATTARHWKVREN